MQYRPGELSDLSAIVDAWCDLAREQRAFGSRFLVTENRDRIRDQLGRQVADDCIIVAIEHGQLVGFVSFTLASGPLSREDRLGFIENIYVDAPERGRGIGSTLLAKAECALDERGATVVELEVLEANRDARRFYRERDYMPHRRRLTKRLDDPDS